MAITSAIESAGWVKVYDGQKQLFSKDGELVGYTSGSVSVLKGTWIRVYDETGKQIAVHPAR